MSERLKAALFYSQKGFLVFPIHSRTNEGLCDCGKDCDSPAKHPFTPRGFKDATTDETTIRKWFSQWPQANIGIATGATSGIVILDVDPRNGGNESLAEFIRRYGELPHTLTVKTGGKGMHYYFLHPRGEIVIPSRSKIDDLPGLDVKGDGGYVVAPPSVHITGALYIFANDPNEVYPTVLPEKYLEVFTRSSLQQNGNRESISSPGKDIVEGERNTTLTSLAGSMRRKGASRESIETALLNENSERVHPPLPEEEVKQIAKSVARYSSHEDLQENKNPTDWGNAKRLVARHGNNIRYVPQLGKWLIWDGQRWKFDEVGEIYRYTKDTVAQIKNESEAAGNEKTRKKLAKHAQNSESEGRFSAMIKVAQTEPGIAISPQDLDKNPFYLNCQNGILDLITGKLLPHHRDHLLTKLIPINFDPDAKCERFKEFLNYTMGGKTHLIDFLQAAIGYSLTGSTREQVIFLLHGTGANGKTTLLEIVRAALGNYATQADVSSFLTRRGDNARNDLARLAGARFVSAVEVERGRGLAEALVKHVTGGDMFTARFLYREYFEFHPQFKIWISVNHKPVVKGTDFAIWRRIRLIPFTVTIPEDKRDSQLLDKLRAELPGILAWIVEGCIRWQNEGLYTPNEIKEATNAYKEEMDELGGFLSECCKEDSKASESAKDLYRKYKDWCEQYGEPSISQKAFGLGLGERGFQRKKNQGIIFWHGIRLQSCPSGSNGEGGDNQDDRNGELP